MPLGVATKTVQNVVDYVTRQFGDESGAQITQADIIRWINAAQLDLAYKTEYSQGVATTSSVVGQTQYQMPGTNILKIKAVLYDSVPLDFRSFTDVQENILSKIQPPNTATGTPTLWYEWDDSIYLFPIPESVETIQLYYIATPATVSSTTDTLSIPDNYYQALLQWIMSQAYELDDDMQSAAYKSKQLGESLAGADPTYSQKYYPTITILSEDADL